MISAKVVAVAKTTHKFIVYRHASLIALLTAQPIYAIRIRGIKTLATVSLYRLLGVCAFGAFMGYSILPYVIASVCVAI